MMKTRKNNLILKRDFMTGEIIVTKENEKRRLDVVFFECFPNLTRAHIKKLIEEGSISVNGKSVKAGFSLREGQKIEYNFMPPREIEAKAEEIDFEIVYEDKDLVVVNKPQGLVVHPCSSTKSGTLVNGLLSRIKDLSGINGELRPGIVHRLDKNTSGLMVVAKNDASHISLSNQIKNKTCKRKYIALLEGHLKEEEGHIETYLDRNKNDRKKISVSDKGRIAITNYKLLKRYNKYDLVEFSLQTGRTHQIRVHAKHLGHPVVGDEVYGKADKNLKGQLLHSYSLTFTHPRTNKEMHFEIALPIYFKQYLDNL